MLKDVERVQDVQKDVGGFLTYSRASINFTIFAYSVVEHRSGVIACTKRLPSSVLVCWDVWDTKRAECFLASSFKALSCDDWKAY